MIDPPPPKKRTGVADTARVQDQARMHLRQAAEDKKSISDLQKKNKELCSVVDTLKAGTLSVLQDQKKRKRPGYLESGKGINGNP